MKYRFIYIFAALFLIVGIRPRGGEIGVHATNLTYLSSSGVRVILYCKKYLSNNLEIVFINCNKDILDVLDFVGVRPYITFINQ